MTTRPDGFGSSLIKLLVSLLAPLVFMLMFVPTGFLLESPGPSFDLQEELTVDGAETYDSQGELMLTAVSLQESRLAYHLLALFEDSFELMKVRDYLGDELDSENQDIADIVITFLSQDTAVVAGLRQTGVPVEVTETGLFVAAVAPGYPAYGEIDPGDVIVAVNGEPVQNADRFTEIVGSTPEGETISLQVREIDEDMATDIGEEVEEGVAQRPDLTRLLEEGTREVELQPVYEQELGRSIIGISFREYFTYTAGVEVEWDLEEVKGPSAGLMMTLSLVNALTPNDLTLGKKIAGTGEIALDGDVGPIGGLTPTSSCSPWMTWKTRSSCYRGSRISEDAQAASRGRQKAP